MSGSKYLRSAGRCQARCRAWRDKRPQEAEDLASEAEFQTALLGCREQRAEAATGLVPGRGG